MFTGTQTHIWLLDTAPTLWIKATNGPTIIYGNKFESTRILSPDHPGIDNKACPTLTSSIFLLNWSFSNHLGANTTNTQSLIHTYIQLKGLLTQTVECSRVKVSCSTTMISLLYGHSHLRTASVHSSPSPRCSVKRHEETIGEDEESENDRL